jgi:ribosomal protein S18 acetylase RimI-like enzyme
MAALIEPLSPGPEIIDLRRLAGRELDPLLLEETVEWQQQLDWDFAKSADLVRQYSSSRALTGCALIDRREVAGYGYTVLEDQKGLIGDVYIRPLWRNTENQVRLLRALLEGLIATPHVRRVESQLMLIDRSAGKALQQERFVRVYERMLLELDRAEVLDNRRRPFGQRFRIEPWAERHEEPAAVLIPLAYKGHIDSQINDQYRSPGGARRFIYNIVQYPGCGSFFKAGSFAAFDIATRRLAGLSLVSFVAAETGHITQLCVAPSARGAGLGYELLRQSVNALRMHGARRVSLTVTTANQEAVQLYLRCGFREVRRFFAYVWEGFA